MKKFNVIDFVIILVVVIAVGVGGFVYFKSMGSEKAKGDQTKVSFDIEFNELEEDVANSFKNIIGNECTYGNAKTDKGKVVDVEVKPYKKLTSDMEKGIFKFSQFADKYTVIVTLEANVFESDSELRQDKEYVRVGGPMTFHTKGVAGSGYIINVEKEAE